MFKRWQSGVWGMASLAVLAIVALAGLGALGLPAWLIWAAGLFMGCLLLLAVIGAVRGSAKRPQEFSAFESNALGQPVAEDFVAPYHHDLPADPAEAVLGQYAPIMQVMSGLGDLFKSGSTSFLGKGKTRDAENAVVLTGRRLVFLMIGPDELRRFAKGPKVTGLLEALPGDAAAKRRMLFNAGAAEVRRALAGLLGAHGPDLPREGLFSFSVPLGHIEAMGHSAQKRTLRIQVGGRRLSWFFKYPEDLDALVGKLAELGLPSASPGAWAARGGGPIRPR